MAAQQPVTAAVARMMREAAGDQWTVGGRYLLYQGVLTRLWQQGRITAEDIRAAAQAVAGG